MFKRDEVLPLIIEDTPMAYAYHQIILDDGGTPVDYVFLDVNRAFEGMTGLKREHILSRRISAVLPGIRSGNFDWVNFYGKVALTGVMEEFEQYSEPLQRWYSVKVYAPQHGYFVTCFWDITKQIETRAAMETLLEVTESLLRKPFGVDDPSLYKILVDGMLSCSGARGIAFCLPEPEGEELFCRAVTAVDKKLQAALADAGFAPGQFLHAVKEMRLNDPDGVIIYSYHSVSDLPFRVLSRDKLSALEKEWGLGKTYLLESLNTTSHLGTFILFMGEGADIKKREMVNLFAIIAGHFMQRINAEHALRQSEERYKAVLQSQQEMICRFLPDTTLTFVNMAYCNMFGRNKEELLGRKFLELIPPTFHDDVLKNMGSLSIVQPSKTYEHSIELADGTRGWQEWTDTAIFNERGEVQEIQSVGKDISELRRSQEEALAASRAKSEFLSKVSHELRTPLHAIISYADLGMEESREIGNDELIDYFTRIHKSGSRFLELINDLLDINKIETGKMAYHIFPDDLYKLGLASRAELGPLLEKKGISLEINKPSFSTRANIDYERMLQVMSNIINNGIKFSPKGSRISVIFSRSQTPERTVSIHVQDEGCGIPEADLPLIFEKFQQSGDSGLKKHGTGLGLAISREIVLAHGGQIRIVNNDQQGVTVTITLPALDDERTVNSG